MGADSTTIADRHAHSKDDVTTDMAAFADRHVRSDDRACIDLRPAADSGGEMDLGGSVDAGLKRRGWIEQMPNSGKGQSRIGSEKQATACLGVTRQITTGDNDACAGVNQGRSVARVAKETQIAMFGRFQIADVMDHNAGGGGCG